MDITISMTENGMTNSFHGQILKGEIPSVRDLVKKIEGKVNVIAFEKTEILSEKTETQVIAKDYNDEKNMENIETDIDTPPDDGDQSDLEVQE